MAELKQGIKREEVTPSELHIVFDERKHSYLVNDRPVPTVTQVLRILDKPALGWWHFKVGLQGVSELAKRYGWNEDGLPELTTEDLITWLKREKLTPNYVRNAAGDRGKYVHQALEALARDGQVPDPRTFPPEGRGYVKALGDWWGQTPKKAHASEVLVASLRHGFAGTFDLFYEELGDGSLCRLDAKTAKGIYPEMFLQLEAYELAAIESGYPESDVRIVLRVAADGTWEAKESPATAGQFLAILGAYNAMQDLKSNPREGHGRGTERANPKAHAGTRSGQRAA